MFLKVEDLDVEYGRQRARIYGEDFESSWIVGCKLSVVRSCMYEVEETASVSIERFGETGIEAKS